MHIEERGSGAAVVLLHGTPSTTRAFGPLVERLARRYRVLVPEMPGYGQSPPLDGEVTVERTLVSVEDELVRRRITRAVLVGHSAGAYRALAMALRGRVSAFAVVAISGFATVEAPMRDTFLTVAELVRRCGVEPLRATWLDRMAGPSFRDAYPGDAKDVLAWLDAVAPSALAAELEALARAGDLRPALGASHLGALVLTGTMDAAVPTASSEALAAAIPHAELRSFAGGTHALLVEHREEVVNAVCSFVDRAVS